MSESLATRLRRQADELYALADALDPIVDRPRQKSPKRAATPRPVVNCQSLLVQKAVAIVGNQDELARRCSCTRCLIGHLVTGRNKISACMARLIDAATSGEIPHWKLRPDLWSEPEEKVSA